MARPLRIEYPGALYHITSRGNARQRIFLTDTDRRIFLKILHLVIKRYGWKCYAYCLMDNHYHVLIETAVPNLSLGMRLLNGKYTQQFNYAHKRTGHIFQGRFKALLVEQQNYLMALSAYIILNPVRAKIVDRPEDWTWSSYRSLIGIQTAPEWLDVTYLLEQFGVSSRDARERYKAFVSEQSGLANLLDDVKGQIFLGTKEFIENVSEKALKQHNQTEIPKEQRHANRPNLEELFAETKNLKDRNNRIVEAHIKHSYKQAEIAKHLGLHYVTISKTIANHRT